MKLLLYCTKSKPYLNKCKLTNYNKRYFISNTGLWSVNPSTQQIYPTNLNGKVVAECDFEVEKMGLDTGKGLVFDKGFNKGSQLELFEIAKYVGNNYYYAIHIKNLNIFDKARPTKWYGYTDKKGYLCMVEKAPQNMMYCYDEFGNDYILISIHPEWLCKILNGEKTIIVRKKVLREML